VTATHPTWRGAGGVRRIDDDQAHTGHRRHRPPGTSASSSASGSWPTPACPGRSCVPPSSTTTSLSTCDDWRGRPWPCAGRLPRPPDRPGRCGGSSRGAGAGRARRPGAGRGSSSGHEPASAAGGASTGGVFSMKTTIDRVATTARRQGPCRPSARGRECRRRHASVPRRTAEKTMSGGGGADRKRANAPWSWEWAPAWETPGISARTYRAVAPRLPSTRSPCGYSPARGSV
jgi:hypothetical protein